MISIILNNSRSQKKEAAENKHTTDGSTSQITGTQSDVAAPQVTLSKAEKKRLQWEQERGDYCM